MIAYYLKTETSLYTKKKLVSKGKNWLADVNVFQYYR